MIAALKVRAVRILKQRKATLVANYDRKVESEVHQALIGKIGQDRFELWFDDGARLHATRDHLVVTAPSSFQLDRLRRTFLSDLKEAADAQFGANGRVEFVVEEAEEKQPEPATQSPATIPLRSETAASTEEEKPPAARQLRASLKTFVVSEATRLAYTAIDSVPNRLGCVNPIMVHGPTGCGKSHLLSGLAASVRQQRKRVVMLSAEEFTTWFLGALNERSLPSFRYKHRNVDLLIVDDIQFFAGKRATIVEFKQTIDAIGKANRQIVLAGDRPPQEMTELGPEIQNRLVGGLPLAMGYADEASRRKILQQWAADRYLAMGGDAIDLLAERASGDVRQLRGALNRVEAMQDAFGRVLSMDEMERLAADCFPPSRPSISLPEIEKAVCRVFGLQQQVLQSGARTKVVSQPRMLAMWLARKYTRAAFSEIGAWFGNRSHSTVISAERKVDNWRKESSRVRLGHGDCPVDDAIQRVVSELGAG